MCASLVGLDEITVLANDVANQSLMESSQKGSQHHHENGQRRNPRSPPCATQRRRSALRYAHRTGRHLSYVTISLIRPSQGDARAKADPEVLHNGSAALLSNVLDFYEIRFGVGLTSQERSDLLNFLAAL